MRHKVAMVAKMVMEAEEGMKTGEVMETEEFMEYEDAEDEKLYATTVINQDICPGIARTLVQHVGIVMRPIML